MLSRSLVRRQFARPFSAEIKIEAIRDSRIRFEEISIMYSSRLGEIKLNPWADGFNNLWFLVRKRFARGSQRFGS